jgi:hypothetical protein
MAPLEREKLLIQKEIDTMGLNGQGVLRSSHSLSALKIVLGGKERKRRQHLRDVDEKK